MQIFETPTQLQQTFFTGRLPETGFDAWMIAKISHTNDHQYLQLRQTGADILGYQPTMFTLADPLRQQKAEAMVMNLRTADVARIREQYQQRFIAQLPQRFGLFYSDKRQADAIFDSYESFAAEWLERDAQDLLAYNLPVLFDHVSDVEYWGWQQKGFDPCGTQRLIVTVFQYRTGRFADVFITNINDAEMARITLLLQSKLTVRAGELF